MGCVAYARLGTFILDLFTLPYARDVIWLSIAKNANNYEKRFRVPVAIAQTEVLEIRDALW